MGAAKRFTQNPGRNAICYYRYSSEAQRDASIEQQQEIAHEYASAHGLRIIKEYADRAISGTRDDRPDYNLMLYEVTKLKPAYLILWKTDRLSRDRYDSVVAKKTLRDNGVKIVYTGQTVPDDEDRDGQNIHHVIHGHHVPAPHHIHADPVDDKLLCPYVLRFQKADDAVGITDRRNFRGGDHNRPVGAGDGILESLFNSGRRIKDHVIKFFF